MYAQCNRIASWFFALTALAGWVACSSTRGGPTPIVADAFKQNRSDENARIMWNGTPTAVTVTGDQFAPMVRSSLTRRPYVEVPRLYLVSATQVVELRDVIWVDGKTMRATIPARISVVAPRGYQDFKVAARDPLGFQSRPAASFRVSAFQPPAITAATVVGASGNAKQFCGSAGTTPAAFDIVIQGAYLRPGVTVEYALDLTTGAPAAPTLAVKRVTSSEILATVPAGLSAGAYDLRVTNDDGQKKTLADVFRIEFVVGAGCPQITAVTPRFAYRGEDFNLQITGVGLVTTPTSALLQPGYAVALSYETMLTPTSMRAFLYRDAGRLPGWYDIAVTNPAGNTATMSRAVLVVDQPVPRIDNATPDTIASVATGVTITGANFPAGATAVVFNGNATYPLTVNLVSGDGTTIEATIAGNTIPIGVYILRVYAQLTVAGSPELVYADYSNIVIVGSSGNTGTFRSAAARLQTGRREFGLVGGRNAIGERFLYVVGGRTSNTDPNSGLTSIEVAPIDAFGNLLSFFANRTQLPSPRYGLGLVELGGWLYAVGGSVPTGPSNTVLKAKILDPREAPVIQTVMPMAGSLVAGTWLYQVSAVYLATDVTNPAGESLPSIQVTSSLSASGGVRIGWKYDPRVEKYRIYRSDAPDISGAVLHRIAEKTANELGCLTGFCQFSDDGTYAPGTIAPLSPGSLSEWTNAGTLNTARAFHATAIARSLAGDPFVYAIGGVNTGAGAPLNTFEYAAITPGANLVFNPGNVTLNQPRRDAAIAVATKYNTAPRTRGYSDAEWILVQAGSTGSASSYSPQATNEYAQVQPDGTLSAWQADNYARAYGGTAAVISSNVVFQIGGSSNYLGSGASADVYSGQFDMTGPPSGAMQVPSFNSNGGARMICTYDESRLCPRAFFGFTRFNAQIFIVGGAHKDHTGALAVTNTTISVFY